MKETNIQNRILLAVSNGKTRLFRNNTLQATAGQIASRNGSTWVIKNARAVRVGLCPGSSDLIGFKTITITPEMVGKQIAVFTAVEVKTKTGRVSKQQKKFISLIKNAGGLAGVARSPEQAKEILNGI